MRPSVFLGVPPGEVAAVFSIALGSAGLLVSLPRRQAFATNVDAFSF